jgi:hypothetical protein
MTRDPADGPRSQYGRYVNSTLVRVRSTARLSAATPMTSLNAPRYPPVFTWRPIGSCPGHNACAALADSTTTCRPRSVSSNVRPLISGVPIAAKYPGVTYR